MSDARRAGHCVRGVRAWFHEQGLDFRDFVKNGIALERVAELKDGYGDQIIARKRARESSGGG
jgi:hypothetical protein